MIADRFDRPTLAKMEVALERACSALNWGQNHETRRHVARQILRCARRGNVSLEALTEAGSIAATELSPTHGG
jgi:hypothetical protein